MISYKPNAPFSTPMRLLIPIYTNYNGVRKKTFPAINDGDLFFCSFKTFGGTEVNVNGVYSVEDTATVECWYRDDITSACRIAVAGTSKVYEIIGDPENIDMRNQYLRFKVQAVKGGA
jgi:head-tail adaptor